MLESDSAQLDDTFLRDVIDVWRHLKQRHTTATCEGIRVISARLLLSFYRPVLII